ncbi:MAG: TfoX/Sxy family protein [Chlamydiales bacterium]|nr:TfoX/Sxy family protein [Chlamydiales bacterium]
MGKWKKSPQALIDQFYEVMEAFELIQMRKMFGYPCSFLNGHMLTGLHEENWVLRLPEAERDALSKKGGLPFEPMGRRMKEYLKLPQEILQNTEELKTWIEKSIVFVSTLDPK